MKRTFLAMLAANILICAVTAFGLPAYLILYVPVSSSMTTQVNRLKTFKEGQGYQVIVKTSDYIYSLYGTGTAEERIKQYIADTYANPSYDLRYVLIISGDGWEPTGHIPINFYMGYSDDWYVDVEGDDLIPDISVGRLPFTEAYMLENYVDKLELYALHSGENWNKKVLISVEDYDDPSYMPEGWTREQYFEWLRAWAAEIDAGIPSEIVADELRSSSFAPDNHIEYRNRINSGRSVNIHLGYARYFCIGGEYYPFVIPDPTGPRSVTHFENSPKFTFHYAPSCQVGCINYGEGPYVCTVFNFIADKAAIGFFAPITMVDVLNEAYPFTPYFLNGLFKTNDTVIGDVVRKVKETAYKAGGDMTGVLPYFELYCDPSLVLNVPYECLPKVLGGFPVPLYANQTRPAVASADLYPPLSQGAPVENPPYFISGSEPKDIIFPSMWATWSYDDDGDQNFVAPVPEMPTASTVADINSDGLFEVIAIEEERVNVYDNDGEMLDNFPVTLNEASYYPAAVGDVDGDGYLDIVVASVDRIYVLDHNGTELFHADLPTGYFPIGSPAVGDLDHNGDLEIVVGTQSNSYDSCICVYDKNGNPKPGWPYPLGSETLRPPVLADLTGDGTVEVIVASNAYNASPPRAYYRVVAYTGSSINFKYYDNYVFKFTPAVGDFVPWGSEWLGKETVVVGYNASVSEYEILALDADDGTTIRTISMGDKVPTSAPTVGDVNALATNEVVIGCEDCLMAYDLNCGLVPFEGHWKCTLKGDVTTPAVTDLNGDGGCDIVCSDNDAVYAFTTNTGYLPLENFDWVRDGHDNLNMGLWDIAAPTGVVAEDYADDQGGKIVIAWTPSVDNGVRSSRVNEYEIYLGITPPGGDGDSPSGRAPRAKLAEGKRAAALRDAALIVPTTSGKNPGYVAGLTDNGGTDEELFIYLDSVYPPACSYIHEGLENGWLYKYRVVATDGTHKSQPSVIVSAVPHDNIPPAPPTNFDLDVIHGQPPAVRLMWTRSYDDPLYEEGGPGDSAGARAKAEAYGVPGTVASPGPASVAGTVSGNSAAVSVAPSDAGGGSFGTYDFATGGPAAFTLSAKEGEAAKIKAAEGRGVAEYYVNAGPRLWTGKDHGLDAGANDVVTYVITKSIQGEPTVEDIYYYPITPGNDVEYLDEDVSYGYIYSYTVAAMDGENLSEAVGPLVADLLSMPPGPEGPSATALGSPFDSGPFASPFDGAASAAAAGTPGVDLPRGDAAGLTPPSAFGGDSRSPAAAAAASPLSCGPNPVTSAATVTFKLETPSRVHLAVYDLTGRCVATLADGPYAAGEHAARWQADVPTGVYVYRLQAGDKVAVKKVVVAR